MHNTEGIVKFLSKYSLEDILSGIIDADVALWTRSRFNDTCFRVLCS